MTTQETGETRWVDIDKISVPRERVTSVWDPAIEEEFMESVKTKGILVPVDLMEIDSELWLTDGLHRLQAAEKLGLTRILARIVKGSLEDLMICNIILNRQRGRSNPAQEAEVLALLVEKKGFPLTMAAKQLGLSENWARKLMKIATLPQEVKDLIKIGRVPVTGAAYIADLPRAEDQSAVARDAEFYKYTADQIKVRVWQILNPDVEPKEGETTFTPEGKPAKVPLTCHFCGAILPENPTYVWVCGECLPLARETIEYYRRTYTQPSPTTDAATPPAPP